MIVKKWLPYSIWDFAGIEHWLNEQAQSGCLLNGWPGWSFIGRVPFRTDPDAPRTRYRLDPGVDLIGELELQNRIASYQDVGWRYEGKVGRLYAIYSCDDPQAPELYSDTSSMALAMKKTIRRTWLMLFLLVLWLGSAFWDEWIQLFTSPASLFMSMILRSDTLIPLYLLMIVLALSVVITNIGTFAGIHRIRAALRRGEWPTPGRRNYPEPRNLLLVGAATLLAVVLFIYFLCFKASDYRRLSGPEEWAFPHVALEELIPSEASLRLYNNQELLHYDSLSWSTLAPEQYNVAQGGMVQTADGTQTDTRLYQEHVRALSPTLAWIVYEGRVEEHRRSLEQYQKNWEENTPFLHDQTNAFDSLQEEKIASRPDALTRFTYQYSDRSTAHVVYIGLKHDRVFVLDCSGMLDADAALSLLLERLEAAG